MPKKNTSQTDNILDSKDLYHKIFKLSPDAIVILNKKGTIVKANQRLYEWLGYEEKEIIGKNIAVLPFFDNKTKLAIAKKFADRIRGKKVDPYEVDFITKDKKIKLGEIRGTPIKDDNGKIIGDLVIAKDLSDIAESKEKIESSFSRIQAILAAMDDMVLVFDEYNTLVFYNSSTSPNTVFNPAEFVGQDVSKVFPEGILEAHMSCFNQNKKGNSCEFEYTITDNKNIKRWYSSKMSPIMKNGEFTGSVSVIREITNQKNAQIILKEKAQELEKLNDLMVGREVRMTELKEEIARLKGQHISNYK